MGLASLRQAQIVELREKGYVVVPRFVPAGELAALNQTARSQLAARSPPLELETDLQYPGAPPSQSAVGGETVRRLLDAYARDPVFAAWATALGTREWMEEYFGESVLMSCAHHNCLMTKHPLYGSLTGWHRDIRYWSFAREDLVSVWLALGEETVDNGALWFVPKSHAMSFGADRFDAAKFFRADRGDNTDIIRAAVSPRLAPGDAAFFHCNTLHSAGKNSSDAVKFSLVFTYHGRSNAPKTGSRSASKPEIDLGAAHAVQ
ncbi:MAG TPA: phytanoyl-CoA dioxygenase family protein [Steroidobacteraceae bacterium]|nr:phytanoyl-CoA dioxygenase family protein [Steroidobacteraceae bacterium]